MNSLAYLAAFSLVCVGCAESMRPDGGTASDSAAADTGSGDAGMPTTCGGFGGGTCSDTEYCDYGGDICGAADGTGVCRPRPGACPDVFDPVCGCDGIIHSNQCDANAAGVDVNSLSGSCTPDPGQFSCGFRFCSDDNYCRVVIDDTGMPPAYECFPFPSACDGMLVSCTCLAMESCGFMCMADGDGHLTLTCPGG